MKDKIKGKYNEDLSELPVLSDLVTTAPTLKLCPVCNQPNEKHEGNEYTKYRVLAKKAKEDEFDVWTTEHTWDYSKTKVLPYPDKHVICERVKKLEGGTSLLADQILRLGERLHEMRHRPLVARIKNRIGALLHGIAEGLQR